MSPPKRISRDESSPAHIQTTPSLHRESFTSTNVTTKPSSNFTCSLTRSVTTLPNPASPTVMNLVNDLPSGVLHCSGYVSKIGYPAVAHSIKFVTTGEGASLLTNINATPKPATKTKTTVIICNAFFITLFRFHRPLSKFAGELGIEPRVSCSKGRRVAGYTTPQ